MTNLSKLFHHLCGKAIVLFASLLIEFIIFIRKQKSSSNSGPITTKQYLKFIEERNPTICYTKGLKPRHVDCTVCLSEFEEGEKVRKLNCQHTFHRDCLDTWLQQCWATCPLCRKKVLPDDVVSKHRRSQVDSSDENIDNRLPILLSALRGGYNLRS